jgi:exonuclease VII large subunit
MSSSTIAKTITTFLFKTFWPWFLKHIWPLIVKHLLKELAAALQTLSKKLKVSIAQRLRSRAEEALKRAAAADATAKAAQTNEARSEAEAIARVWREVAEQFRKENEVLQTKLDQATSKVYESAQTGIENGQPVLAQVDGQPTLAIGGHTSALPALPSVVLKTET